MVDILWLVVGGGEYILAGTGWWWMIGRPWWAVVGRGGYILDGGGWWWVVLGQGGWWHNLVLPFDV